MVPLKKQIGERRSKGEPSDHARSLELPREKCAPILMDSSDSRLYTIVLPQSEYTFLSMADRMGNACAVATRAGGATRGHGQCARLVNTTRLPWTEHDSKSSTCIVRVDRLVTAGKRVGALVLKRHQACRTFCPSIALQRSVAHDGHPPTI